MKNCRKCNTLKDESEFYVRKGGTLHSHCKSCIRAKTRAWYAVNSASALEKGKIYARERRARTKEATFAAYGGYACACCGETERKFLTLDHINNDGAAFRRSLHGKRTAAGYITYRHLATLGFPAGYQVLCMNCNHGKRMNNGVCPHKTRCNDQSKDVGPSGPKHSAPALKIVKAG